MATRKTRSDYLRDYTPCELCGALLWRGKGSHHCNRTYLIARLEGEIAGLRFRLAELDHDRPNRHGDDIPCDPSDPSPP